MIALVLSSKNYLTLTRVSLRGKRRREMTHWIILKIIMLGLKKSQIIKNLRHLFYVLNLKFVVFLFDVIIFEFLDIILLLFMVVSFIIFALQLHFYIFLNYLYVYIVLMLPP